MLTSLAYVFLLGMLLGWVFSRIGLPSLLGMLVTGILLGPCVLNLLDPALLGISADLRQMALIIILIKEGLSLDLGDLRRVGRPAVLMSFLPASFEILAYILFAPMLLGITRLEAAVVMILLALCVRAVGVLLALTGTRLDWKERLFCVIAYLPKATVQAAIGSVPLAMGPPCGALVLSVAVLAILITAPLGPSASTVPAAVCCVPQTDLPIFPQ